MSDKVRFYLEQSVQEIQDLKKRGIFTDHELQAIIKRRTEYEHKILARTVKPAEFISYANYENSVDKLRALRLKKLKKQGATGGGVSDYAGPRRINFIWDRAVRKFPASLDLWTKSVDYAKSHNMVHVVNKALVSMLRLHPTKPEVWVYVAKYQAEENASIIEARTVLQRGLRFNKESSYLWLEYMRLELIYVAKVLARRRLLGLDKARKDEVKELEKEANVLDSSDLQKAEQDLRDLPDINVDVLGDVSQNPALRGDIALAVFDAAIANDIGDKLEFCEASLKLFDEFTGLNRRHLCSHVISYASQLDDSPKIWDVTLPIRNLEPSDPSYPEQLRVVMVQYNKQKSPELAQDIRDYFAPILEQELEPSLRKALELFLQKL